MHKQESKPVYISFAWQQHEQLIEHLSKFSQNVLLMVAPYGAGKTTFLEHFLAKTTPSINKKHFTAKAHTNQEALLKEIVNSFGLSWQGMSQVRNQLQMVLEDAIDQEQTWLLFIDDAHLLSNEQLHTLLHLVHLEENSDKQLRLILLGEPSLEIRIFSPEFASLANGKIYTIELESWTQEDIQKFLALKRTHLSPENIAHIFSQSDGLPGEVMKEIKTYEQHKIAENQERRTKRHRSHPISIGIFIGLLVGGSYLFLNNNTQEESVAIPTNAAQVNDNAWSQEISGQKDASAVTFHFDKIDKSDIAEDETHPEKDRPFTTPILNPQAQNLEKGPIVSMQNEPAAPEVIPEKTQENKAVQEEENKSSTTTQIQTPPSEPAKKTASQNTSKPKNTSIKQSRNKDARQLLTMNKHHYTLQLLGASKEESVKKFIKNNSLEDKSYTFKTKRQGKDWYIVVYGEYPNLKAAKAAASHDSKIQHAHVQPWVREIANVHQDIKQG